MPYATSIEDFRNRLKKNLNDNLLDFFFKDGFLFTLEPVLELAL